MSARSWLVVTAALCRLTRRVASGCASEAVSTRFSVGGGNIETVAKICVRYGMEGVKDMLTAYNQVPIPAFMYGTAWKKDATTELVQQAVAAGFTASIHANQLIHYQKPLVGEALLALAKRARRVSGCSCRRNLRRSTAKTIARPTMRRPTSPPGEAIVREFAGASAYRLSRFVCAARSLLPARTWRRRLGSVGGDREGSTNQGRTKMIGISNVSADQLRLLCERAVHKPMVVQNRCYAALGWDQTCGTSAGHRGSSIRVLVAHSQPGHLRRS